MAKKKADANKLRPFVYEMEVEVMADNDAEHNGIKLVSICGTVKKSNFMEEGARFCAPLAFNPIRHKLFLGDKLRVTLFCRAKDIKKTEGRLSFSASGLKYEVWDDASEGWTCLYEKFEKDSMST